jgi:DNA replication protein DnaC
MLEEIKGLLDGLRLRGMNASIEAILVEAEQQGKAISDVLLELLKSEYGDRQERALEARMKRSKLPWPWTLDTFPFERQPGVIKSQIMGLAKLEFIKRSENLIFIGKPGRGKSGIAMGLLRLALLNGYRGRFYNAQDMLNELYASLADRSTSKLMNTLSQYDVLLIDELGYLTLTQEQTNIFFKLIDMRYKRKSTLITTNLDFPAWYDVFKQKELVDALLDRFQHHCTTICIKGPSLRTDAEDPEDSEKPEGSEA